MHIHAAVLLHDCRREHYTSQASSSFSNDRQWNFPCIATAVAAYATPMACLLFTSSRPRMVRTLYVPLELTFEELSGLH